VAVGLSLQGQINLRDAVRRDIQFTDPKTGKLYKLNSKIAVLKVRVAAAAGRWGGGL
jgi:malate synthase